MATSTINNHLIDANLNIDINRREFVDNLKKIRGIKRTLEKRNASFFSIGNDEKRVEKSYCDDACDLCQMDGDPGPCEYCESSECWEDLSHPPAPAPAPATTSSSSSSNVSGDAIKLGDELVLVNQWTGGGSFPNGTALGAWRNHQSGNALKEIHSLNPAKLGEWGYKRVKFKITGTAGNFPANIHVGHGNPVRYGDTIKFQSLYETDGAKKMPLQVSCCPSGDVWHNTVSVPSNSLSVNIATHARRDRVESQWRILRTSGTAGNPDPVKYGDNFVLQTKYTNDGNQYIITWGYGHGMGNVANASAGGYGVITATGLDESRHFKAFRYSDYSGGNHNPAPASSPAPALQPGMPSAPALPPGMPSAPAAGSGGQSVPACDFECMICETEGIEDACSICGFCSGAADGGASMFQANTNHLNQQNEENMRLGNTEAQSLIEFERNVIARTDAENKGIGCTVQSTPARTCTDGLTGQPRFRACIEQGNMWEDLNTNPILRHFVNAYYETCDEPPCGEPIMTTALKAKVYGSPTELNARLEGRRVESRVKSRVEKQQWGCNDACNMCDQHGIPMECDICYGPECASEKEATAAAAAAAAASFSSSAAAAATAASAASATTTDNPSFGIGWLKIPTTSTNNLFADWGTNKDSANHSYTTPLGKANGDYTIYGDEHLTLLIVRKFTRSESKKIFDALANQPAGKFSMRQPKHVKGYNFIFTKEGHISFIPSDGSSQVTYLNPIINPNDQTSANTQEAGGKGQGRMSTSTGGKLEIKKSGRSYDQSNTMAGLGTNGTGKFNAGESYRNGMELVYAMNPKVVMNKASTYILYTPADQEILIGSDKAAASAAAEESKYYLLYNPIHTLEFRRFYQSYLQSEVTAQADSPYTEPHWNGFYNGLEVADPEGCRSLIPVPSMSTIFAKYCNAFQIKGLKNNSAFHYIKHYADPVCPYILSDDSSFQAFTTNTNTTHESTRNDYYKITGESTNYGAWKSASTQFSNIRDNDAYNAVLWACPNHGVKSGTVDDNIHGWIGSNNWLEQNSPSFIKDVIITEINKGNWEDEGKSKLSLNRIPDNGRDPQNKPECRFVEANFTSCAAVVYSAGNMTDNQIIQQQQCGIPGKAEVKSDDDKGTQAGISDDQKHSCHQLEIVPECPDYGTPGEAAAYITVSGVGEVYTGCCKLENDLLGDTNCIPPNGGQCEDGRTGGQIVDGDGNVTDAGADASDSSSDDKLLLTKAFERITERITKASDVALTSKIAYPTDLIIVNKSDTLIEEAEKDMRDANTLKAKIDTFGVASVTYVELETEIGQLSLQVKNTEKLSQEIVILIANNYLFGFKKMYVIGGGALLVFLIILIVLMKKK